MEKIFDSAFSSPGDEESGEMSEGSNEVTKPAAKKKRVPVKRTASKKHVVKKHVVKHRH
jgi:hypothetical protein